MQSIKKQVIQLVESMEDDVTLDDIMEELYFRLQIDTGLKELNEGKGIPHSVVKDRISKWQKK